MARALHRSTTFSASSSTLGPRKQQIPKRSKQGRIVRTSKIWHPSFKEPRWVPDRPFTDTLDENDIVVNVMDALLHYTNVGGTRWDVEQVQEFLSQPTTHADACVWMECRTQAEHESKWLTESDLTIIIPPPVSDFLLHNQTS
jgi:hypothetical protein